MKNVKNIKFFRDVNDGLFFKNSASKSHLSLSSSPKKSPMDKPPEKKHKESPLKEHKPKIQTLKAQLLQKTSKSLNQNSQTFPTYYIPIPGQYQKKLKNSPDIFLISNIKEQESPLKDKSPPNQKKPPHKNSMDFIVQEFSMKNPPPNEPAFCLT